MIDQTLIEEMTRWHDRYLIRAEHSDHLTHLMGEIESRELALRQNRYLPPGPDRKTGLAKIKAAKLRLAKANWDLDSEAFGAEANVLLGRAVDAGIVSLELGSVGEEAVNIVRDLRAGRSAWGGDELAALIQSGRLVPPTMGRCVRCSVARGVDKLDQFTSATSSETLYICRGRQDPPNDPDLGPWLRWLEGWGLPCCDPEYAPEPASVD
jgi:hypothetical protein